MSYVLAAEVGFEEKLVDVNAPAKLLGVVEDFRRGFVSLIVPVTLIRHDVRLHSVHDLAGQISPEPRSKELMFRNHV